MSIGNIQIYAPRWQCIVLLFAVLNEVRGGMTKSDAIERIAKAKLFDIHPEDLLPYPANKLTTREPRWITTIAWARKDAVEHHLMQRGAFDNWDLEGVGRDYYAAVARACRDQRVNVRRCYLWSPVFKARLDASYSPGQPVAKRPLTLYEGDWAIRNIDFILGFDAPSNTNA